MPKVLPSEIATRIMTLGLKCGGLCGAIVAGFMWFSSESWFWPEWIAWGTTLTIIGGVVGMVMGSLLGLVSALVLIFMTAIYFKCNLNKQLYLIASALICGIISLVLCRSLLWWILSEPIEFIVAGVVWFAVDKVGRWSISAIG